jgi:hypothetical protein
MSRLLIGIFSGLLTLGGGVASVQADESDERSENSEPTASEDGEELHGEFLRLLLHLARPSSSSAISFLHRNRQLVKNFFVSTEQDLDFYNAYLSEGEIFRLVKLIRSQPEFWRALERLHGLTPSLLEVRAILISFREKSEAVSAMIELLGDRQLWRYSENSLISKLSPQNNDGMSLGLCSEDIKNLAPPTDN